MKAKKTSIDYDATMKSLVDSSATTFFGLLGYNKVGQEISGEFGSFLKRRADFVAPLNSTDILHVEFQTKKHDAMAWRMLEYYCLISEKHKFQDSTDRNRISQEVIYIGAPRSRMAESINKPVLYFNYKLRDIRDVDPHGELLKSKRLKEQILGLLCVPDHHAKPWGDVLRSIERRAASDRQEARNLLVHFAIVASLRAIPGDLVQRMRNLGMQVEIDRSELLKDMFDSAVTQGAERGRSEHAIEMLREELDFAGVALSDEDQDFVEQLSASDVDTLRRQVRNGEDWPALVYDRRHGIQPT